MCRNNPRKTFCYHFIASIFFAILFLPAALHPEGQNLIENPGFEIRDDSGNPQGWKPDSWQPGSLTAVTDKKQHSGKYCAVIDSSVDNDVRLIQTVKVKPDTIYRFSGWAAVRNVAHGGTGVTLCVMGGFVRSQSLNDSQGWKPLEFVFKTLPKQKEVTLAVRLGYYGEAKKGIAYFDDLVLEEYPHDNGNVQLLSTPQPPQPVQNSTSAASKISWLILALGIFYLLYFGVLNITKKEISSLNNRIEKHWMLFLILMAGLALIVRLPLFPQTAFQVDMDCFKGWAVRMADTGPFQFYADGVFCDYPPFPLLILWLPGLLVKLFPMLGDSNVFTAIIKFPSYLFDAGTAFLIIMLLKKKSHLIGLFLGSIYLLLPSVLYNSGYWGQIDSLYTFLILLTFFLITKKKPEWAVLPFAASLLTKTQTLAFVPFLLFYFILQMDWKEKFRGLLIGIAGVLVIALPFLIGKDLSWIVSFFSRQAAQYPYAAFNAANFMTLFNGNAVLDSTPMLFGLSYQVIGISLFLISAAWACFYYFQNRNERGLSAALFISSFAFFMFFPRMHERYLFPALAFGLLTAGYFKERKLYFLVGILGLSYFINLHSVVLKFLRENPLDQTVFNRILYILSLVNTVLFALSVFILQARSKFSGAAIKQWLRKLRVVQQQNIDDIGKSGRFTMKRKDYLILGGLIAVYAFIILFRLGTTNVPKTGEEFNNPRQGIEIRFYNPVNVSRISWYDAEGEGQMDIQAMVNNQWMSVGSLNCKDYYVLLKQFVSINNVDKIRLIPNPSAGVIKEIGFYDSLGGYIPVQSVFSLYDNSGIAGNQSRLFDEPETLNQTSSYRNSTYFDEIYHGRTAYEFVKRLPVYETTHPPLGKDILSVGVRIFGMNPFGIRIMHALAGIALALVMFFLGREVFGTRFGAFALLTADVLDFMPFVQSRYASIDTTSVLFISLMLLFTIRFLKAEREKPSLKKSIMNLIWILVSFGLAASVKWTAIYGFAGVVLSIIIMKIRQYFILRRLQYRNLILEHPGKETIKKKASGVHEQYWKKDFWPFMVSGVILFLLIVPVCYYLSYQPYLNAKGIQFFSQEGVSEVLKNQKDMYDYHSRLDAKHPFSSSWWAWPFDFKPLWLYLAPDVTPGHKGTIVTMGNPIVWWTACLGLFVMLFVLLKERKWTLWHNILLLFFSFYLPWALVSRVAFIYHFYPALPLFYVFAVYLANSIWKTGIAGKITVFVLTGLAILLFVLYYPALTGLEVSSNYVDKLRIFSLDWLF